MISHSKAFASRRNNRGKAFLLGVAALALLAVGGFAAYKYFFERPGEAASALIPGDADVVVTLDTSPSERQIEVFKKITDALEREGIAQKIDDTLKGFLEGKPVGAEIRPYLSRSFALGFWMREGSEPEVVTLCAVSDPGAVKAALERNATAKSGGIYVIPGTNDHLQATVVDGFLALGGSEQTLQRIEAVRSGKEASVTRVAEYNAARNALPADANLMVFISPRLFKQLEKQMAGMPGIGSLKGTNWMAYGATVEPEGIAFDYYCPMDASKFAALKTISGTKPFNMDSLKLLPEGAYGVAGYSQAGRYWNFLSSTMAETPEASAPFEKAVTEFETETGLNVEKDVVPAFQGEILFAMYPGATGKPEDFDAMLTLTDSNGANPAQLAAKLREFAERKSAKEGKPVHFTESKIGDVTVWEIDGASREQLTRGLFEGFTSSRPAPKPKFDSEHGQLRAEEGPPPIAVNDGSTPPEVDFPTPPAFLDSKTVIYAQMGNSVVACSSRALLTRTIENRQSGKSLANEASFATMKSQVVEGSQCVVLVNVHRIMEALRPVIESGMKNAPFSANDFTGMFGDGLMGIVISGKYDGNVAVGRFMLPLDFERCIHMMGGAMRGAGPGLEEMNKPLMQKR